MVNDGKKSSVMQKIPVWSLIMQLYHGSGVSVTFELDLLERLVYTPRFYLLIFPLLLAFLVQLLESDSCDVSLQGLPATSTFIIYM